MKDEDMYNFYAEISFIKIILWVLFTFVWLIMTFLLTSVNSGWFDAVIERTNIYFFYIFWFGISITIYIFLYVNVYKKGKKKLTSCVMCIGAMILLLSLSWCSVKLSAFSYKHFSSNTWKECKNVRKYMIYDLINNHNIIGMEVDEAIKLLGEPIPSDNIQASNKRMIYLSGRNPYIIIFIVSDNKIINYTIR